VSMIAPAMKCYEVLIDPTELSQGGLIKTETKQVFSTADDIVPRSIDSVSSLRVLGEPGSEVYHVRSWVFKSRSDFRWWWSGDDIPAASTIYKSDKVR
jgi:hypothetical protein